MKKNIGSISLGAMWVGASISIAEILTGTYAASLGVINGLCAVLVGHLLGCLLFFAMAYLGARYRINSMRVSKLAFGHKGACIFAALNAIQLFGWASVMIYNGGLAVDGEDGALWIFELVAIIITVLLLVWLLFVRQNSFILNTSTVVLLGLVCLALSIILMTSTSSFDVPNDYTFSQIIEFSAAMPLSWLPVVADYTAKGGKPFKAAAVASISYTLGGCWMYFIGMFAMLKFGADDIYKIMQILPIAGVTIFVIVISTVVNTYLDGVSAGESVSSFSKDGKFDKFITPVGVFVLIGGFFFANIMYINHNFVDVYQMFLGYIAAVFGPMAAVIIVKVIFFKGNSSEKNWDIVSFIPWAIGFITYEVMVALEIDTVIGITLPVTILTMGVTAICQSTLKSRELRPRI